MITKSLQTWNGWCKLFFILRIAAGIEKDSFEINLLNINDLITFVLDCCNINDYSDCFMTLSVGDKIYNSTIIYAWRFS